MKKILIVNDNMNLGGIQMSLCNILCGLPKETDVTLLLFNNSGDLKYRIPDNIKVITPKNRYRILGMTKNELKKEPCMALLKAVFKMLAYVLGKRKAMRLFGAFQKRISGYDVAVSFSHPTFSSDFTNGCAEFVLDKVNAEKKICYIHCDFSQGGFNTDYNKHILSEYDKIACVSNSVKAKVDKCLPEASEKTVVVHNLLNRDTVLLSNENPVEYESEIIAMIIVARLSPEKGIDRAIKALANSQRKDIRLYILGDGPQKPELEKLIDAYAMTDTVLLLGQQKNPYRYMKNADYLLVPSVHEAAPMIFDEANQLGLPIITTATTSAAEMVTENGIICENNDAEIEKVLRNISKSIAERTLGTDKFRRVEEFCKIL